MNSHGFPTGEAEQLTVAIRENRITVAPGSRVTLQAAIVNESLREEELDILVKGIPPEWLILHTPVVHLTPGETKAVSLSIQPSASAGQRAGRYPLEIHAISQSNPKRAGVGHSLLTVAAYESRGRIGVLLGSAHFAATPGSSVDIPILLQNRGEEDDSFRLNVTGLPESWVLSNSTLTRLEPGAATEIQLNLQIPRSPRATAGRWPFTIQLVSELYPTQTHEVECILTVSAFAQFSTSLEPDLLQAGQPGQVTIENEGNTIDVYSLGFQSPANGLIFEKPIRVAGPVPQGGAAQPDIVYMEIPPGERFQVPAGQRGTYSFRSRLRSRPIFQNEQAYPFKVNVQSGTDEAIELAGQVSDRGWLPFWVLPVGASAFLILCLLLLIPLRSLPTAARATQTASFSQTEAALSGPGDSDGDGLTNEREAALGTDPLLPDTDGDRLGDREEVEGHLTDPLDADSDDDGLPDGDEIQVHQSDPRNADTDGDGRSDGNEIAGGSDPRSADTDGDGLRDGDEIRLQTDPRNADTDGDGLQDGQETETCPRPRDPDSDDDGLIDGRDLEPCQGTNPALTATGVAQATSSAPTLAPTATSAPTNPSAITQTAAPPGLQGMLLFSSNRDGNSEIYVLDLARHTQTRLTNSPAQDMQPALAPDSVQVAYVTNQDGNNEVYLSGLDGRAPLNLTNHAGDDQEPAWSPDGDWIAFTTNRDGNQEIYVMRRDGSEIRNLTNNAANDFAPTWFSVRDLLGTEDWIAFTTTRDGNQEIYRVKPDGTGLTNLTRNPANDYAASGFAGGGLLAFVTERDGNPEIYTMTDGGGAPTNVTKNPARDLEPAIEPGASWIAFATDRDGNLEVYVVGTGGGAAYNLTGNPGQDRYPEW